jgi:glycosyltransferase domain-containing protein
LKETSLNRLTIVIFTYNRHELLKRTINYWLNYDVKLLILDGSNNKIDVSFLHSKKIKYIHNTDGLEKRLLKSIDYIDTEFLILSGDDEFYLPSAICSCIKFLDKKPSFSSCGGRAVGFFTKSNFIFGTEEYSKFKGFCLDDRDSRGRTFKHFFNYTPAHIYSVMRLKNWKIICKYIFEKKISFSGSFELSVEFLTVVAGKSIIIQELMWMRNKEVGTIIGPSVFVGLDKWWLYKKYQYEKLNFFKQMVKACDELLANKKITAKEIKDIINNAFEIYIKQNYPKRNFLNKIKDLVPNIIKIFLVSIIIIYDQIKHRLIRWHNIKNNTYNSLSNEVKRIEKEGVFINYQELNKVISFLKN